MRIILSSKQHVGKTTACEKLVALLETDGVRCGGILCLGDEVRDLAGGSMRFLHHEETDDSVKVGRFWIGRDALDFAERAILSSVAKGHLTFVDEYGMLEWRMQGLHRATEKALERGRAVILVRETLLERFLERFKAYRFEIFVLDEGNRDILPVEMKVLISSSLS